LPVVDIVIVPPYFGVPRLSHQCPVVVAVVTTPEVVDVVAEGMLNVVMVEVVVVLVVVVVVVAEDVVVVLVQDAKTSDITMRKVSTIQIALFFKLHSFFYFYILEN
jgi:hypothetical protein